VHRVRDACGSGYTFLVANAEALPFAASFDVVLAGEIVEHVHNMGQVLDSAWRALRRSGHLIVTTPNNFALSGLLYAGVRGREACHPEHVCYYSVQTLSYIVERHGFKIEDVCVVARQAKRSFIQRLYEALERWHPILAETIVLIASKRDERIKYSANW
jgi:ubiquinone/menaquinone biosynthesis C-methylase UbiE